MLLIFMSARQIGKAAEFAKAKGLHRIATMISTLSTSTVPKFIQRQNINYIDSYKLREKPVRK
jgi:hypothetical protein